jgi:hypothetical protein
MPDTRPDCGNDCYGPLGHAEGCPVHCHCHPPDGPWCPQHNRVCAEETCPDWDEDELEDPYEDLDDETEPYYYQPSRYGT